MTEGNAQLDDVRGDPSRIDGPWMTAALEAAGVAQGATVTDVTLDRWIGTGQTGANARMNLTWDDPDGRPATVVGKFPSQDEHARTSAFGSGSYVAEFVFYSELVNTVDIRTPHCYVARLDVDIPDFVLIMEDLIGCEQGDQIAGCSVDQCALAIEQAVALHTPRWGDETLGDVELFKVAAEQMPIVAPMMYAATIDGCVERLSAGLEPGIEDLARAFGPALGKWTQGTDTPRTLIHGDYRPDNLLFGVAEGAPPLAVVDWQTMSRGIGMADLAYLVGGGFQPAERAKVEKDLVEEYRSRIEAAGITYSKDDAWRDYVIGSLHGVFITVVATVLAAETERGNEMLAAMANRHCQHAIDLGALDLLAGL